MPLLRPDWVFDDYSSITVPFLQQLGVRLLLTDLDFTLAPKKVHEPGEQVRAWLDALRAGGIDVVILSNNRNPHRVKRYCQPLGINYIGHAGKPQRKSYRRAMAQFSVTAKETAMLGDKLLTDCLGAHFSGMPMLMVEPKGGAVGPLQKVLHILQEPFKCASNHDMRTKMQ